MSHQYGPVKDPSGTDALYMKVHITVRSILAAGEMPDLEGGLYPPAEEDDITADRLIRRVRHYLCQPRKAFYYNISGSAGVTDKTFAIIDLPEGRDDATGPWPVDDAISVVYTTMQTLEINWSVIVFIRDCGTQSPSDPISNRWEMTKTYDRTFRESVRWNGTCIISALSNINIDYCTRNLIAPLCPVGFKRESSSYSISRDGLRCDYSFLDTQIKWAPIYPAVEMDIDQSEAWESTKGEIYRKGQVTVTLIGTLTARPSSLRDIAMSVARSRIFAASPLLATGRIIGSCEFSTKETTSSVVAAYRSTYIITPNQQRQVGAVNNPQANWANNAIGMINPAAGDMAGGLGQRNAVGVINQQGVNITGIPALSWVGFGTGDRNGVGGIGGYEPWANPNESIVAPADGLPGLATTVKMYAALLQDQCGSGLPVTPNAPGTGPKSIHTIIQLWNTPAGGGNGAGQAGAVQDKATLTAAFSGLIASQYPTTPIFDSNGLYYYDGQPAVYTQWASINDYTEDPGIIVMPTTSPSGTNVAINHSSPTCTWTRRWIASRVGAPPNIPPRDVDDSNWQFVGGTPSVLNQRVASDNVSVIYEAQGMYQYEAKDATQVVITADTPPFLSGSITDLGKWLDDFVSTGSA